MHIPQSTIEPLGVLGFPTCVDSSKLVMLIKNGISVRVYQAIRQGFAEKDREGRFVNNSVFMRMMENSARVDGASEAQARIYGLWKSHKLTGLGFYARFQVPNDLTWYSLVIRRDWE